MKAKYFTLGALVGFVGALLAGAIVMILVSTQPLPEIAQPPPQSSADVVGTIREEYLSSVVADLARSEEEAIQNAVVDVQSGGRVDMTAVARVTILGMQIDVPLSVVTSIAVVGDRLEFTVHKIGIPGIGIPLDVLPASLRSAIERMETDANEQANELLYDNDLVPVSVTTDDTSITISLQRR